MPQRGWVLALESCGGRRTAVLRSWAPGLCRVPFFYFT